MSKRIAILMSAAVLCLTPISGASAGQAGPTSHAYWTDVIHEENSLRASILYIPVVVLQIPIRLISGVIYPKPTSQCPIPPPVHAAH